MCIYDIRDMSNIIRFEHIPLNRSPCVLFCRNKLRLLKSYHGKGMIYDGCTPGTLFYAIDLNRRNMIGRAPHGDQSYGLIQVSRLKNTGHVQLPNSSC